MASFPQGFYGAAHWPPTSLKALILKAVGADHRGYPSPRRASPAGKIRHEKRFTLREDEFYPSHRAIDFTIAIKKISP